jgi:MoxR-like ATPase
VQVTAGSNSWKLVREVPVASHVKDYAVRLVLTTHPKTDTAAPIANQYLRFGSSPRGAQMISKEPIALQLRFLQTMREISSEHNTTTFLPVPIDLLSPFLKKGGEQGK